MIIEITPISAPFGKTSMSTENWQIKKASEHGGYGMENQQLRECQFLLHVQPKWHARLAKWGNASDDHICLKVTPLVSCGFSGTSNNKWSLPVPQQKISS